jgi:hypothetical protein
MKIRIVRCQPLTPSVFGFIRRVYFDCATDEQDGVDGWPGTTMHTADDCAVSRIRSQACIFSGQS